MGGSAPLLVVGVAVSIHTGLAIATTVFDSAGPLGTLWLRTLFAAVLLGLVARRSLGEVRARWRGIVVLGVVLAAMNLCFFEAIARMPLGLAATIEFLGPLSVAVAGIRRRLDVVWPLLAGVGVALLGSPSVDIPLAGGLFAFASAACWAAYIVLAKRVVTDTAPLPALVLAMTASAVVLTPGALATAPPSMWSWSVIATALAVAVLASAVPYLLELVALRLVTAATFGVLLSLEPAVAAMVGLVVLGQALGSLEVAAIGCVVAASAGAARAAARTG
jgi:inner membrane transporter RhtA